MKIQILVVACVLALRADAQRNDSAKMYDISKRVFIEPLALIDVYNASSLRLGIEWPVAKNFCSVYFAYGLYTLHPSSANYGEYVKFGFKLYPYTLFTKRVVKNPIYASLYFFYKSQAFTVDDNIENPNGSSGQPVTYNVKKRSEGIQAEMGTVFAYRHLCFEPYVGLGMRLSTVANSISDSLFQSLYDIQEGSVNRVGNANKTDNLLPSMALGVRLSYLFKSRRNRPGRTDR